MSFVITNEQKERGYDAFSITLRNYSSIESWYESAVRGYYYVNFYKSSTFEDTIISGLPSRKILETMLRLPHINMICKAMMVPTNPIKALCRKLPELIRITTNERDNKTQAAMKASWVERSQLRKALMR